jgi:hypothetical protein
MRARRVGPVAAPNRGSPTAFRGGPDAPADLRRARRRRPAAPCHRRPRDDIEIGCGGNHPPARRRRRVASVRWAVLSAHGPRADEARAAAATILGDASEIEIDDFRDGYFRTSGSVKDRIQALAAGRRSMSC